MVLLPAATPLTTPVALTVATAVDALLHMPPGVASVINMADASQTEEGPFIAPAKGMAETVTVAVATLVLQLLVIVYDMAAVPVAIPVTTPDAETVATAVFALLHTPSAMLSLSAVTASGHMVVIPEMTPASGSGFTCTVNVVIAVVQILVTE